MTTGNGKTVEIGKAQPMASLVEAIQKGTAPLVKACERLIVEMRRLNAGMVVTPIEEPPGDDAPDVPAVARVIDMETAIKDSGQWECGDLVCNNCPVEQNLECMTTYSILAPVEEGMSEEETRRLLHRAVRDAVAVAAKPDVLVAKLRVAPKLTPPMSNEAAMVMGDAQGPAPAAARASFKPAAKTKPKEVPIAEMKRSDLVKMAAELGVKEVTGKTKEELVKAIEKKRKK